MTVEDDWQHRGLGKRLAARLGKLAESRGYDRFTATMLPDNRAALGLIRTLSPDANCALRGRGIRGVDPVAAARVDRGALTPGRCAGRSFNR